MGSHTGKTLGTHTGGTLECWDVGMLGCWDVGMLGCWDFGRTGTKGSYSDTHKSWEMTQEKDIGNTQIILHKTKR